jgi:hypothetical protein
MKNEMMDDYARIVTAAEVECARTEPGGWTRGLD